MRERTRGDDCLTTLLSGTVGLIVLFVLLVLVLGWIFG
jgi:hypothetical protein